MKEIMARKSSSHEGIASFEFSLKKSLNPTLIKDNTALDKLKNDLLRCFHGKVLDVNSIYKEHTEGTCYILKNYQDALLKLEEEGKIKTNPGPENRRFRNGRKTIGVNVVVTFPSKEN